MKYYIDGKFELSENAKIPFDDAGFLYGDGLFETMRFDNKIIFSFESHLKRLLKGLRLIDLDIGSKQSDLLNLLHILKIALPAPPRIKTGKKNNIFFFIKRIILKFIFYGNRHLI